MKLRELAHARSVLSLEERLDVEFDRELDRLAGRARRRDDDHAPGWRLRPDECVVVGQVWLSNVANHASQLSTYRWSSRASEASRGTCFLCARKRCSR